MAAPQTTPKRTWGVLSHSLVRRVGGAAKTSLALVGLGTVLAVAYEVQAVRESRSSKEKKQVLVLPFHRMSIVEKKRFDLRASLQSLEDDSDETPFEIELKELVDIIHAAAQDPNIVALYGVFGHGFGFSVGGYAQLEEIRDAIRVFNESHRVHREPNLTHQAVPLARYGTHAVPLPRNGTPKLSLAYADTFGHPLDSGNKEYFLASAFSHIHLQPQGELNLFGFGTSSVFLKGALDKYGIKAHVFKHGKYKNAPNRLTETGYTKEHLENTKALVRAVNATICNGIAGSRHLEGNFTRRTWQAIHNYGTLTAGSAQSMGFVDFLPRIDPLETLLATNENADHKKEIKDKWGKELDVDKFQATKKMGLTKYASIVAQRKRAGERSWRIHHRLQHLAERSIATETLLKVMGYKAPYFNIPEIEYSQAKARSTKEKIALVHINGGIDDATARKTVSSLRKIKKDKDVKCVILRVDSPGGSVTASESIYQECKDLSKPVICSMGSVAASGGYYVSTDCKRIFALPTTLTGSIGVFGIKVDLTDIASRYGVRVQHVNSGKHSATFDPFQPLTKDTKLNFSRNVDRYYDRFKAIVSSGRKMTIDEVQAVAQGRVWTGEQAKEAGLVDELGGLSRAIAYAQREFTSGHAMVEQWPKRKGFKEALSRMTNSDEGTASLLADALLALRTFSDSWFHYNPTLSDSFDGSSARKPLPSSLTGVLMTIDETEALRCVVNEASALGVEVPILLSLWASD